MKKSKLTQYPMFLGASARIFDNARKLRNNMTEAEDKLWQKIRKGKIKGMQFRRQHPLNIFIADFYCPILKLVIEVDGGIHSSAEHMEYDTQRDAYMRENEIIVLGFTNSEVMENSRVVVEKIETVIQRLLAQSAKELK